MLNNLFKFIFAFVLIQSILFPARANAQGSIDYSQIEGLIKEEKDVDCKFDQSILCSEYKIEILDGSKQVVDVQLAKKDLQAESYNQGDRVFLTKLQNPGGVEYTIVGPVRHFAIYFLVALFVIATLLVGRKQGFGSLIGLGLTISILFGGVVPLLLQGWNPILVGIVGSVAVLGSSIYLSHGFNRKSTIALIATSIGVILIAIIAMVFTELTKLTGYGSEGAFYLMNDVGPSIYLRGVIFVSIVMGGIGLMDDVTVTQVSSMVEIHKANPGYTRDQLFKSVMNIGKDHIASMVNTLFVAYAASSMPLVMLMYARKSPFLEVINSDYFAEEIVRTFVGSIGLILIVPLTSYIASYMVKWDWNVRKK